MITQAQPKPSQWPLIIVISLTCMGGLFILVCIAAFWTGFARGYNNARFHTARSKGNAAYDRGDYQAAADDYSQMVALRPSDPVGYQFVGDSLYKMGRYTAAIADETAAIQHYHGKDQAYVSHLYFNRALAYDNRGDYAPAIANYTVALRLDPTDTDNLRNRAWAYQEARDFSHAIKDANAAIAPRPMWGDGYLLRGRIWQAAGHHDHAAADYCRAMQLSPEETDPYEAFAQMCDDDGKDADAVKVTQAELRAHPGSATCWGSLGWWQYRAGDYQTAIASSHHALRLDDHLAYIWLNIGLCYAVQGNWPMAQQTYADILPYCRPVDVQAGMDDLHNALKLHPHQAAIQQSLALLQHPL